MTNELILAGLLHDIGKFMQRAHEGLGVLSLQSRNMENMLCPIYDGRHSHYHVLFTNEFCENHLTYLPPSFDRALVMNLASYHHKPSDEMQRIIQEADHLSSGMDRREDDSAEGQQHFRKVRLRSILSMVDIGKELTPGNRSHKLLPLTPTNAFPQQQNTPGGEGNLTKEYRTLWDGFLNAWRNNRVPDVWGFLNRALSILEHYTWCIPSATNVLPDISLYDHSKTTAAITACLYSSAYKEQPYLIVAGDFSGIQNYIFDFKKEAGGYAKRLRARSYYVSLLSEAVSLKILRELKLPLTQRILFAGGKFHLLLPNSPDTVQTVEKVRKEMDRWLLERTGGDIRFSLVQNATGKEGILQFADTLSHLTHLLREEKETPYRSILQHEGKWDAVRFMGKEIHSGDRTGVCSVCGKRQGSIRFHMHEEGFVCDACDLDFYLGTKLPQAECIIFHENATGHEIAPNISIELSREYPRNNDHDSFLVKNFSGSLDVPSELALVSSFAVNYVPREGEIPLSFDDIAKRAEGIPRIAYLKGDVDNLGLIFSQGLGGVSEDKSRASISRVATLSRTLEVFFSAHFRHLLETDDRFRSIYTVYAGGDDFLCLGPWNRMIDFAREIREDFQKFCGDNPNWSMSMGLVLAGNHTPVLEGVDGADKLLETSKHIPGNEVAPIEAHADGQEPSKDRISLFGVSIPFRNLPEAYARAREVTRWLVSEERTISTSHIWRLHRYGELYRQWVLTRNTKHLEYIPLLAYDLRRNWDWKERDITPERKNARKWAASLGVTPDMPDMKILKFICEYALLMNRGKE